MAAHSKTKPRQFRTQVNIPAEQRTALIELLNQSLASIFDLYSQTKQAHWNVKGEEFYQLHELFDEIAGELSEFTDLIAERAVAIGGTALGTVRMSAEGSILPEYPLDAVEGKRHVTLLVERFGAFANHVRGAIDRADELGDKCTSDVYTEVGRDVDKRALVPGGPHPGPRMNGLSRGSVIPAVRASNGPPAPRPGRATSGRSPRRRRIRRRRACGPAPA